MMNKMHMKVENVNKSIYLERNANNLNTNKCIKTKN